MFDHSRLNSSSLDRLADDSTTSFLPLLKATNKIVAQGRSSFLPQRFHWPAVGNIFKGRYNQFY
jgi:hypothetical protein